MFRRKFFKDVSFAIIASLLPKVLQPAVPEVVEVMVEVSVKIELFIISHEVCDMAEFIKRYETEPMPAYFSFLMPKNHAELMYEMIDGDQ